MAKAKPPTKKQIERRERIRELGCIVQRTRKHECKGWKIEMHHCGTNAGGRKNHDKQIPLCQWLHQEISRLSLRVWETIWGTEEEHLAIVEQEEPLS